MPINRVGPKSRNKRSSKALYKSKGHIQSGLVNNMTHGAVFSNKINERYNGPFSHSNSRKNKILKEFNSWMVGYNNEAEKKGIKKDELTAVKIKMNSTKKATQEVNSLSIQELNKGTYDELIGSFKNKHNIPRKKQNKFINRSVSIKNTKLIDHFNDFPLTDKNEFYSFNNNTPYSTIHLTPRSFVNGTVRITIPGYYKLNSDIIFDPNNENNFQPTKNQIISGQYRMGKDGAYQL